MRLLGPGDGESLVSQAADQEMRLGYFEPRVAASLYGDGERATRWHRQVGGTVGGARLIGAELLSPPDPIGGRTWGLAILHLQFGDEPLAELGRLCDVSAATQQGQSRRTEVDALLPSGSVTAADARRPFLISHLTFRSVPLPRIMPSGYDAWEAGDQWLWLAASATPVSRFPPDPVDKELFAGRVRFSADWQALVLRDGAAFVGLTPDPGDGSSFHPVARTLVHSIYLDVFLLGAMQRKGVNDLANRVAAAMGERLDNAALPLLHERLVKLRNTVGSEWMTLHGKANELLRAYRRQHQLSDVTGQVVQDLTDSAAFVAAADGRSLNAALGLITVIGLPFGLAYGAGALWGSTGVLSFVTWSVVAVACSLALVLGVGPVRGLFKALRRPR